MKQVPDVVKLKSCFNSCFVTFSCGLFSKISLATTSIVSCKGILVKSLQTSYEIKKLSAYLLYFFPKTKQIFSTMLLWDNWIKKFSEKFRKVVIICAYGRNNCK